MTNGGYATAQTVTVLPAGGLGVSGEENLCNVFNDFLLSVNAPVKFACWLRTSIETTGCPVVAAEAAAALRGHAAKKRAIVSTLSIFGLILESPRESHVGRSERG